MRPSLLMAVLAFAAGAAPPSEDPTVQPVPDHANSTPRQAPTAPALEPVPPTPKAPAATKVGEAASITAQPLSEAAPKPPPHAATETAAPPKAVPADKGESTRPETREGLAGSAPADLKGSRKQAGDEAGLPAPAFYAAILARDAAQLAALCRAPFFFEGKSVASDAEIRRAWTAALERAPVDGLRLLGVDLYSPEEMVAKFGKAPEKLSSWPLKGGTISVGNLSGHAAVVLWKKTAGQWQAVAFHD